MQVMITSAADDSCDLIRRGIQVCDTDHARTAP